MNSTHHVHAGPAEPSAAETTDHRTDSRATCLEQHLLEVQYRRHAERIRILLEVCSEFGIAGGSGLALFLDQHFELLPHPALDDWIVLEQAQRLALAEQEDVQIGQVGRRVRGRCRQVGGGRRADGRLSSFGGGDALIPCGEGMAGVGGNAGVRVLGGVG